MRRDASRPGRRRARTGGAQAGAGRPEPHHRAAHLGRVKPHLTKTFELSNDPQFTEKVQDIVGLYLNPPAPSHWRELPGAV
jgi:hypothetical protein